MSNTSDPGPQNRIRLDPDYGASGLWLFDTNGTKFGISMDRLDLSPKLRQELRAWSDEYERLADTDYQFPSPAARKAFHIRWRKLGEQLAEELGPPWRVETPFGIFQQQADDL